MTKSIWPLIILGMLGTSIAINSALLYFAHSSNSDYIEDRPYERGLSYDTRQHEQSQMLHLGWSDTVSVNATISPPRLELKLTDQSGAPVRGKTISLHAIRPNDASADRQLALSEDPQRSGIYLTEVPGSPGSWILDFSIPSQNISFRRQQYLSW